MIRSEPLTALGFNFCLSASMCTDGICLVTVPTGFQIANVNVDTELFFLVGAGSLIRLSSVRGI